MSLVDDFLEIVDEIYGVYLDSISGFVSLRENIINIQKKASKKLLVSEKKLDKTKLIYGKGNPNEPNPSELHVRTQEEVKERNKKNGRNYMIIAGLCSVLIYQHWDDFFRDKIAKLESVDKNNIEWDIMGDLRHVRRSIIHNQWKAVPEIEKCKILNSFKKDDLISIDKNLFDNIIKIIRNSKYRVIS